MRPNRTRFTHRESPEAPAESVAGARFGLRFPGTVSESAPPPAAGGAGLFVFDAAGRLVFVNDSARGLLGGGLALETLRAGAAEFRRLRGEGRLQEAVAAAGRLGGGRFEIALAGEDSPAECHGTTKRPAWSVACCRDPARRGQFAESYVGMLRAAWRLDDGPSVAVLVGQCRRCGRLHWAEVEHRDDADDDAED